MSMCFSLTASAVASGGLLTVGVLSVRQAPNTPMRLYALIPFIFGVQQGIEALQWLVASAGHTSVLLGYAFLFFAFLWWPVYIPFVAWQLETVPLRRRLLRNFFFLGGGVALYLLIVLLARPLAVQMLDQSIFYAIDIPFMMAGLWIYVIAVCGSGLLSSRPYVRLFGAAVFLGLVLTLIAFEKTFTSVWCYFAAILSAVVCSEVYRSVKKKEKLTLSF